MTMEDMSGREAMLELANNSTDEQFEALMKELIKPNIDAAVEAGIDVGIEQMEVHYKMLLEESYAKAEEIKELRAALEDIASFNVSDGRASGQIIGMGPTHETNRKAFEDAQFIAKAALKKETINERG